MSNMSIPAPYLFCQISEIEFFFSDFVQNSRDFEYATSDLDTDYSIFQIYLLLVTVYPNFDDVHIFSTSSRTHWVKGSALDT